MAKLNMNPIQWHEGMLLMPQHFQQSDLRIEKLITYYISHTFSFFWGVLNLQIDEAVLTTGIFRPIQLEVIMPDGLIIPELPETITALELDLTPFQSQLQSTPLYIYLCVPHGGTDDGSEGVNLPRYISQVNSNVMDINTGTQAIDIPRLTPNLSLQVAEQPPAHYICLPLAQVTFDAKSYSLTNYIPPEVRVNITSGIGQICNELAEQLRQKLGYLQQKVQAVEERVSKDPFSEEIEEVRLKLIAGLLPFEAILFAGNAHPFDIYRSLCGLAGQISGVKYGEIPPRFEAYNHLDLQKTFNQVIQFIVMVLDEIEESYTVIPFTLTDRIFTLQLQSNWVSDRLVLGAKIQPTMTTEDLLNWIDNCVIVTDQYVNLAKDNRVLGVSRKIVSEVPSMNLVATKGVQPFIIDVDPKYIDPKGILCLFNISDNELTRPIEIVLYNANQP
jgi:type VI secretion system protein ImpJ